MVGLERQIHGRPAGLRTHILVCLASTLLIYVTRRLPGELLESLPEARIVLDPTRLAAGIVTGIGFLGAATVIRSGEMVRGITTGACIWCISGIGVVIGYEAYGLAIAGTLCIVVVLVVLDWLEGLIPPVIYRQIHVRGRGIGVEALVDGVRTVLKARHIRVQDVVAKVGSSDEPMELRFSVRCRNRLQAAETLEALGAVEGVVGARWR
jgi:putative Mg2+ transporter-C (MgtC) family protein